MRKIRIKKILNNNAILVSDGKEENIWIGNGIGFQRKPGQIVTTKNSKIDKIFILHQKKTLERFSAILETVPIKYLSIADDIVELAKSRLDYELSETIYISLTDHIYNLVLLHEKGLKISNRLSWEIKKFYPREYAIGQEALQILFRELGITFDEFEAGNIAMHLINSQTESSLEQKDLEVVAKQIKDIIALIRMHNRVEVDEDSLAFDRFVTHLRFFFKRLDTRSDHPVSNPLLVYAVEKYPEAYTTVKLVEKYLEVTLQDDEQLYLTLHIQKLIE